MAHYALQNYADIQGDNPSLVVAFANLLAKFDHDIDPLVLSKVLTQDDPDGVDWWSLPEYFGAMKYDEITESGPVWPATSNAIVRQVRETEDGQAYEHYSLVADPLAHSIIDSLDGKVKRATAYGEISGWATYSKIPDVEFEQGGKINPHKLSGQPYTVLDGENIWDVARKTKTSAKQILEHNGVVDGQLVKAGMVLHIPSKEPIVVEKVIEYEVFTEPHAMHVAVDAGARKWSFGNAKQWNDIDQTGPTYRQYQNLYIHAIARVPIGEDIAGYYLDGLSLGDYHKNSRPAFTTGYSWKDLAEGHIEEEKPAPVPEGQIEVIVQPNFTVVDVLRLAGYPETHVHDPAIQIAAFQVVPGEPVPDITAGAKVRLFKYVEPVKDDIELAAEENPESYPNFFKSTYKAYDEPVVYLYSEDMIIHDLEGRRPSKTRYRLQDVAIAGTFMGPDDIHYGRPVGAVGAGLWFGIPMEKIVLEEEIYTLPTTIPEKLDMGLHLSREEQIVVFFSKWLSKYTAGLNWLNKKFHKTQKEQE